MCFGGRFHSRCLTTVMLKSSVVLPGVSNQVGPGGQATVVSGRSGNDNWLFHQYPRSTHRIITLVLGDQLKKPISTQRSLHQQKHHRPISHPPDATRFPTVDEIINGTDCMDGNLLFSLSVWLLTIGGVIQSYLNGLNSSRLRGHVAQACRRL